MLDYEVERRIGAVTLSVLESELRKLLPNDGEGLEDVDVPEATIRRNKMAYALAANHGGDGHGSSKPENEFAMELLHIMKTSRTFLG